MSRTRSPHRQVKLPKTCLFCGAVGPLTKEHIYGDWLRKLGYTGTGVREIIPGDRSQPIIQRGGPFSKKLAIACDHCNHQWMSCMEKAAQPLFTAMFYARGTSVVLDEDAQLVLARWAFKTAAVAAQVDRSDPFPIAHRREFHQTDCPPKHAQIRIGTASIPTLPQGEQLAEFKFDPRTATVTRAGQSISFPFYRASFRLLTVVFDVVGYVTDDVELEIEPGEDLGRALLPLWPSRHPKIWWPPVTSLDGVGGVPGLTSGQLIGLPTLLPSNQAKSVPGQVVSGQAISTVRPGRPELTHAEGLTSLRSTISPQPASTLDPLRPLPTGSPPPRPPTTQTGPPTP